MSPSMGEAQNIEEKQAYRSMKSNNVAETHDNTPTREHNGKSMKKAKKDRTTGERKNESRKKKKVLAEITNIDVNKNMSFKIKIHRKEGKYYIQKSKESQPDINKMNMEECAEIDKSSEKEHNESNTKSEKEHRALNNKHAEEHDLQQTMQISVKPQINIKSMKTSAIGVPKNKTIAIHEVHSFPEFHNTNETKINTKLANKQDCPKTVECTKCDFSASGKIQMMQHFKGYHKDRIIQDRSQAKVLNCSLCNFTSGDKRRLDMHQKFCHRIQQFLQNSSSTVPMPAQNGSNCEYQPTVRQLGLQHCTACSFKTSFWGKFTTHLANKHPELGQEIPQVEGEEIIIKLELSQDATLQETNSQDQTSYLYQVHQEQEERETDDMPLDLSIKSVKNQLQISQNNLQFQSKTPVPIFSCTNCDFKTAKSQEFKMHLSLKHGH